MTRLILGFLVALSSYAEDSPRCGSDAALILKQAQNSHQPGTKDLTCADVARIVKSIPVSVGPGSKWTFRDEAATRKKIQDQFHVSVPDNVLVRGAAEYRPAKGHSLLAVFGEVGEDSVDIRPGLLVALTQVEPASFIREETWFNWIELFAGEDGKYPNPGKWTALTGSGQPWVKGAPRPLIAPDCLPCKGWQCSSEPVACFGHAGLGPNPEVVFRIKNGDYTGPEMWTLSSHDKKHRLLSGGIPGEFRQREGKWLFVPDATCENSGDLCGVGNNCCARHPVQVFDGPALTFREDPQLTDLILPVRDVPAPVDCANDKNQLVWNTKEFLQLKTNPHPVEKVESLRSIMFNANRQVPAAMVKNMPKACANVFDTIETHSIEQLTELVEGGKFRIEPRCREFEPAAIKNFRTDKGSLLDLFYKNCSANSPSIDIKGQCLLALTWVRPLRIGQYTLGREPRLLKIEELAQNLFWQMLRIIGHGKVLAANEERIFAVTDELARRAPDLREQYEISACSRFLGMMAEDHHAFGKGKDPFQKAALEFVQAGLARNPASTVLREIDWVLRAHGTAEQRDSLRSELIRRTDQGGAPLAWYYLGLLEQKEGHRLEALSAVRRAAAEDHDNQKFQGTLKDVEASKENAFSFNCNWAMR